MTTVIKNIGQLVTCSHSDEPMPPVDVLTNTTLTVVDDRIEAIGDVSLHADEVVDAQGAIVLPGFIDSHTHLVFAGNRCNELSLKARGLTYQQIAAAGGGILSTVQATQASTEEQLLELGLKHLSWCLRNGTTTLESKSGYGLDLETELHILLALHRVDATFRQSIGDDPHPRIHSTFLGLHAVPPDAPSKDDHVRFMIDEVLPLVHNAGLASSVDAFVEEGYFSHDDARRLASKAQELAMGLHLHVDQLSDNGGAKLAADLGAMTADHLEQASAEGIAALKNSETIPVLLPASVVGLGLDRYPDARAMISAGLPVALATDFNPGSSPTPSIPFVMALASRHMKMTPDECIAAVTVNGARALDLNDRGRLATGQKADFSVWNGEDWRECLYWIDGPRPSQVWVNGRRAI